MFHYPALMDAFITVLVAFRLCLLNRLNMHCIDPI